MTMRHRGVPFKFGWSYAHFLDPFCVLPSRIDCARLHSGRPADWPELF
jgi:hypothetical protein